MKYFDRKTINEKKITCTYYLSNKTNEFFLEVRTITTSIAFLRKQYLKPTIRCSRGNLKKIPTHLNSLP